MILKFQTVREGLVFLRFPLKGILHDYVSAGSLEWIGAKNVCYLGSDENSSSKIVHFGLSFNVALYVSE